MWSSRVRLRDFWTLKTDSTLTFLYGASSIASMSRSSAIPLLVYTHTHTHTHTHTPISEASAHISSLWSSFDWTGLFVSVPLYWSALHRWTWSSRQVQDHAAVPKSWCMLVKMCPWWHEGEWFLLHTWCHMTSSYHGSKAAHTSHTFR